jgi:hypothetical protein
MLFAGTFATGVPDGEELGYRGSDALSASNDHLAFREGPTIARIDSDTKSLDEVEELYRPSEAPCFDEFVVTLCDIAPYLVGVGIGLMDSSSSMLYREDGERAKGPGGLRVEFAISDGTQVERILKDIDMRCWASGYGWAFVSAGGQFHTRSLVDLALTRPHQPEFCAVSVKGGESRRRTKLYSGGVLEAGDVPPLPEAIKEGAEAEMRKAYEALKGTRQKLWSAQPASLRRGLLVGEAKITFSHGGAVAANDLAMDGQRYDGMDCLDPLEPEYDGERVTAKFFWNEGKRPGVHSFAHGSRWYHVRCDEDYVSSLIEGEAPERRRIVRALALFEGSRTAMSGLEGEAAKALKLGPRRKELREDVAALEIVKPKPVAEDADLPESVREDPPVAGFRERLKIPFPVVAVNGDGSKRVLEHVDNVALLLKGYGITHRWNVITKGIEFTATGLSDDSDNAESSFLSLVRSLAALNGVPFGEIGTHLLALASRDEYNPVRDYFGTLVWDGRDRIQRLAEATGTNDVDVAVICLRRWLLQTVAAGDGFEIGCRQNPEAHPAAEYVLVFVGEQGRKKTKGLRRFLPRPLRKYFGEGITLVLQDRDSVKAAISHWVVELGELGATFRKSDREQLKAFTSRQRDELRLPYARRHSRFRRYTSFAASVNNVDFLIDQTGNRRFLPLSIGTLDIGWSDKEIEQLWAQAWHEYTQGEQWWPTREEDERLKRHIGKFESTSWIEDRLRDSLDWGRAQSATRRSMSSILEECGVTRQDNRTHSDARGALRRLWKEYGAVEHGGELFVVTDGGQRRVYHSGGKNHGWLAPPVRRIVEILR